MTTVINNFGELSAGVYKVVGIIGDTRGLRSVKVGCGHHNGCDINHNPLFVRLVNNMFKSGYYQAPTCTVIENGVMVRCEPFKICNGGYLMVRDHTNWYDPTENVSIVVETVIN